MGLECMWQGTHPLCFVSKYGSAPQPAEGSLPAFPTEQCDAQWASSLHKPAREPSSLHVTQG